MTKPELIFDVSLDDFEQRVIQNSFHQPVLVDLWAEWCPPCLTIAPILTDLVINSDMPILLAKVEVDEGENMKIAGRYQARGFPTVLLIHQGQEIGRFSGAKTLSFMKDFLTEALQSGKNTG